MQDGQVGVDGLDSQELLAAMRADKLLELGVVLSDVTVQGRERETAMGRPRVRAYRARVMLKLVWLITVSGLGTPSSTARQKL